MLRLLGLYHPFFRPLIRRLMTMGVLAVWALVELVLGNPGWAAFCVFLIIFCALAFFIFPDPNRNEDNNG